MNAEKPVWVELGLQTVHERTAEQIRRGYPLPVFEEAYRKLKARGLTVIVHVIFGLPGETKEDMLDTVRYLAAPAPSRAAVVPPEKARAQYHKPQDPGKDRTEVTPSSAKRKFPAGPCKARRKQA